MLKLLCHLLGVSVLIRLFQKPRGNKNAQQRGACHDCNFISRNTDWNINSLDIMIGGIALSNSVLEIASRDANFVEIVKVSDFGGNQLLSNNDIIVERNTSEEPTSGDT